MTNALTPEQKAERRARVAASNRSFGRILSVIGFVLILFAVAMLVIGAIIYSAADAARTNGVDRESLEGTIAFATTALTFVPGVVLLLATCALIPGEQLRRGWIGPSAKPQKSFLPSASMVSEFSVLGFGWHILWTLLGLAVSAVLVGVPVVSWFTGSWPATLDSSYDFSGFWVIYGSLAFAITAASAVSLLKKYFYRAAVTSGRATAEGGPGKAVWRWIDYRWRLDLWVGGIGGLLVALSFTFFSGAVGPSGSTLVGPAFGGFAMLAVPGIVLIALGAVAAAQFWRAGEALGSGESFA